MTLLADPASWPFTYRDLSVAGVELAPEQWNLLTETQHRPRQALTVGFVQCPFEVQLPKVAEAVDEHQHDTKWYLPAVVDLRPEWWQGALQRASDAWLRYPTAAGRAIKLDEVLGEPAYSNVEGWRLWMLWPIEAYDVDVILEQYRALEQDFVDPIRIWADAVEGRADVCRTFALSEKVPDYHHDHVGDPDGVWMCNDGQNWLEEQWDYYCRLDTNSIPQLKALPEPDLPEDLLAAWRHLVTSSQQVSWQLFNALPERERPMIYRTEKDYCPWLS